MLLVFNLFKALYRFYHFEFLPNLLSGDNLLEETSLLHALKYLGILFFDFLDYLVSSFLLFFSLGPHQYVFLSSLLQKRVENLQILVVERVADDIDKKSI